MAAGGHGARMSVQVWRCRWLGVCQRDKVCASGPEFLWTNNLQLVKWGLTFTQFGKKYFWSKFKKEKDANFKWENTKLKRFSSSVPNACFNLILVLQLVYIGWCSTFCFNSTVWLLPMILSTEGQCVTECQPTGAEHMQFTAGRQTQTKHYVASSFLE